MDTSTILPEEDREFLGARNIAFELTSTTGWINVIIKGYRLPGAYVPETCDLLLRLPPGYPNANPDMFWTTPGVRLRNGAAPLAADVVETYDGHNWQRWSRHNQTWRAGTDSIQTKLRAVRTELELGR